MRTRRLRVALLPAAVLLTVAFRGWHPPAHSGRSAGSTPPSSPPATTKAATSKPASSKPASKAASKPPRDLAGDLTRIFGPGDSYSVAALDLTTGRSTELGAGRGMVAASLVKLDFLETLLYQSQRSGQPLTDDEDDDARAMIQQSDNVAADRIWHESGFNPGVQDFNSVAGLHDTVLDPGGVWGLSTTSARDQLMLLRALTSTGSPLTAASREYALTLMTGVEADQRWGVSAAADDPAATANKNGWLDIDDDGGRWAVSSAGLIRRGGHPILIAVLSQHQPDYLTAVARVQQAAVELAGSL